jgi:hypothetical protein
MHFTNIYEYDSFLSLIVSLQNNNLSSDINNEKDNDKFFIGKSNNILRFWKSEKEMKSDNIIGCLDYTIDDYSIKIEYMSIRDKFDINYISSYTNTDNYIILDDNDAIKLKNAIINYLESIAKENNIKKIIIDVHNNLNYYNHYYKDLGFILTNKRCFDNSFWFQTEKLL